MILNCRRKIFIIPNVTFYLGKTRLKSLPEHFWGFGVIFGWFELNRSLIPGHLLVPCTLTFWVTCSLLIPEPPYSFLGTRSFQVWYQFQEHTHSGANAYYGTNTHSGTHTHSRHTLILRHMLISGCTLNPGHTLIPGHILNLGQTHSGVHLHSKAHVHPVWHFHYIIWNPITNRWMDRQTDMKEGRQQQGQKIYWFLELAGP